MRLTVREDGRVLVSAPRCVLVRDIETFVHEQAGWINERRLDHRKRYGKHRIFFSRTRYMATKEYARAILKSRVGFLNEHYGFTVGSIAVRNQRTLWGSCSTSGNLNFNYRLVYLPHVLQEYVVVHELCHLGEHSHSKRFWLFVAQKLPHFRALDRELKRYNYILHA